MLDYRCIDVYMYMHTVCYSPHNPNSMDNSGNGLLQFK